MNTHFKQRATVLLCIAAFTSSTVLVGCGGGGGSSAPTAGTSSGDTTTSGGGTTTPVIQKSLAVATLAADSSGYIRKVVDNGQGTVSTYFIDSKTQLPVQAIFKDKTGTQSQIFYSPDNSINKIVNLVDKSYVTITYETDAMTVLAYDSAGKFLAGSNLKNTNGVWSTAPVLGSLGQISASASSALNPSSASALLLSGGTVLGASTPLSAAAQKLLTPTTTTASQSRWLNMLIPSAYAQTTTVPPNKALISGGALMMMGAYMTLGAAASLALPLIGTAVMVAGVIKVGEGIVGLQKDATAKLIDGDMENTLSNDMANGGNGATTLSTRFKDLVDGKIANIKETATAAVKAVSSLITGTTAQTALVDDTIKSQSLPLASTSAGSYTSTFVDTNGTVYNGTAQIAASGALSGTAASSDGSTAKFSGTYNATTSAFDGVVSAKNASGVETIPDTAAALAKAQADWAVYLASNSIAVALNLANKSITNAQIYANYSLAGNVNNQNYAGQQLVINNKVSTAQYNDQWSANKYSAKRAIVGQCKSTTQSGGQGTFAQAYDLGISNGKFDISYDMYSISDAMTIVLGGQQVYTTGGLVSGYASKTITYSGGSTAIVTLSAPTSGTAWTFTIGCGA
jgi:hypothetical protein